MTRGTTMLLALALAAGCNDSGEPPSVAFGGGPGSANGSGGGFSAGLSHDLAKSGSGSGSGAPVAVAVAVTDAAPVAVTVTVADAVTVSDGAADAGAADTVTVSHPTVPVPAELAAIKLTLLPDWERDVDEAGTISMTLHHGMDITAFRFHYGYEDVKAPVDRDAYKLWLGTQHILDVAMDRQRGAAWYLEGKDGNGAPAFRYLVNYGGKHLICYGSLYKDADASKLGKQRDEVVIAAKKICETLSL